MRGRSRKRGLAVGVVLVGFGIAGSGFAAEDGAARSFGAGTGAPSVSIKLNLSTPVAADDLRARLRCVEGPCAVTLRGGVVTKRPDPDVGAVKKRFKLRTKRLALEQGDRSEAGLRLKRQGRAIERIEKQLGAEGARGALKLKAIATNESAKASVRVRVRVEAALEAGAGRRSGRS